MASPLKVQYDIDIAYDAKRNLLLCEWSSMPYQFASCQHTHGRELSEFHIEQVIEKGVWEIIPDAAALNGRDSGL